MSNTNTVRLTIADHFDYREESPERFDWSLVINHREKEVAETLAAAVVNRRGAWLNEGREGVDPLIPGLQEALRLLATKCIWRVTQNVVADRSPTPEEASGDNHLRDPRRQPGDVPLSAQRPIRVRQDGRKSQVSVARVSGSRAVGKADGPRDVSYALGVEQGNP